MFAGVNPPFPELKVHAHILCDDVVSSIATPFTASYCTYIYQRIINALAIALNSVVIENVSITYSELSAQQILFA
jgi:hypothetical protein